MRKRNRFGKVPTRNVFSCRPFLFWKKETVRTPKKKAGADFCRTLLSPAPKNPVITGMFYFRALRPTLCGFRGRCGPLRGACVFRLGRAPPKGFESVPKASPGTAAGGQESRPLFHIDPRRREQDSSPPGLGRAFFFGIPKPFLFGPVQKEMRSGTSRPGTAFPADHFFFGKKKRSAPQRKKHLLLQQVLF